MHCDTGRLSLPRPSDLLSGAVVGESSTSLLGGVAPARLAAEEVPVDVYGAGEELRPNDASTQRPMRVGKAADVAAESSAALLAAVK